MKTKHLLIYLSLIFIVIASCGKEGLEGPEGAQGPTGAGGPKGDPGTPGTVGPAGADGSIIYSGAGVPALTVGKAGDYYLDKSTGQLYGPKTATSWGSPIPLVGGSTGPAGPTGATGAAGTPGSKILSGTTAPSQSQGAVGDYYLDKTSLLFYGPKNTSWGAPVLLKGAQGTQGPVGPPGEDGSVIYSGAGAPAAGLGQNGDYYFDKTLGTLYGPKTTTGWGIATSLVGPAGVNGTNGTNGATILSGNGVPSNTLGRNGDFYLDLATYLFYGPKASNAWNTRVLLKGAQGPQGPVGPAGTDGSIIYSGNGAPGAALGNNGDYYFDKTAGALYGPKTNAGWGTRTVLMGATGTTGATGANGTNGNTVLSGNGAPSNTVGKNGDFYLDITTYILYGPKASNAWSVGVLLKGAQGAQGPVGPAGADGSIIYSGTGVPDPGVGSLGDYYFDKTNKTLYGPKTRTGWGTPTSLIGATGNTGAAGAAGATILSGTGVPANTLGNNGDFYLDKATYLFYGPKTGGVWGAGTSLKAASSAGPIVSAYETANGTVLNWSVSGGGTAGPPTSFLLTQQPAGAPLATNSFRLPDSVAATVSTGIVLVYLHVVQTGANSNWIQLSYTNVLAANNIQYYTFKTITNADGKASVEIDCNVANTGGGASVKLDIDKVRIVVVPGSQAGNLGTARQQPLTHTMQQFHLNDSNFNKIK